MGASPGGSHLVVAPQNLRGFRGLTLDGYGALLQGGPGEMPRVLTRLGADWGRPRDSSDRDAWRNALRAQYDTDPFVAFREAHRNAFLAMFKRFGIHADPDPYVDEAFDEYRQVKVWPEVPSVLRELKNEVAMAVVSNMDTAILLEAMHDNGLDFTFVVTSEEEQRYKPSPSIFQRAIRYLGLPAANIVHVGDSYVEDVVGASSVGMGTALLQRTPASENPRDPRDRVVHDLQDLRGLIHRSWD